VDALIQRRAEFLTQYQNKKYAAEYGCPDCIIRERENSERILLLVHGAKWWARMLERL